MFLIQGSNPAIAVVPGQSCKPNSYPPCNPQTRFREQGASRIASRNGGGAFCLSQRVGSVVGLVGLVGISRASRVSRVNVVSRVSKVSRASRHGKCLLLGQVGLEGVGGLALQNPATPNP